MTNMDGPGRYIVLPVDLLDGPLGEERDLLYVLLKLMALANTEDSRDPRTGEDVKKGQLLTSIPKLTNLLYPSQQGRSKPTTMLTRSVLDKLSRSHHEVIMKSSCNGVLITICGYDRYVLNGEEVIAKSSRGYHEVITPKEREREEKKERTKERKEERERESSPSPTEKVPLTESPCGLTSGEPDGGLSFSEQCVEAWNQRTSEVGGGLVQRVRLLTKARIAKLTLRSREAGWLKAFTVGLTKLPVSNDANFTWQPDFDWIIANDNNAVRLAEGVYSKSRTSPQRTFPSMNRELTFEERTAINKARYGEGPHE